MTDFSKMELTGLPVKFFEENRNKYFNKVKERIENFNEDSVLILKGGDEVPKYDTDTSYYYFYQEANFYYLTGVVEPSLDCIVDFKNKKITLCYEEPDKTTQIWQTVITKQQIADKYNLEVILKNEFENTLKIRNAAKIYTLTGFNDASKLPILNYDLSKLPSELSVKVDLENKLYSVLKECRKEKTTQEQELMKFICDVSSDAHIEMIKNVKPDLYERDIENIFNIYCSEKFYTRLWGYPCIGASGCNSATLHYEINNKKMKDGELFLADMGMRFCNYVSDVTCTVPVNGKFTDRQKAIYDIVLKSNREMIKILKPGVDFTEIDKQSKLVILEGLQNLGLVIKELKGKPVTIQELYDNDVHKYFMPHRLGHYVGIEVHDVNIIDYLYDQSSLLKEGNVVTVEPGIYFRDFLLEQGFKNEKAGVYLVEDLIRTYYDFGGVRIEDDILITSDGCINMNSKLPRTTEEIENIMKKV